MKGKSKTTVILVLIVLLAALTAGLFSCKTEDEKLEFSSLSLTVSDETVDYVGEYQIKYGINNFEKYKAAFQLTVEATVIDGDGKKLIVGENLTINTESDKIYEITVSVNSNTGERKTASYTLTTKKTICTVTFMANGELVSEKKVEYGQALTALPQIPDVAESDYPVKLGYVCTGVAKKSWGNADLTNVTADMTVTAIYTYHYEPLSVTVSFETQGGSHVDDMIGYADVDVFIPPNPPQKAGFFFTGWYADEERKISYEFSATGGTRFPLADLTLHAGWANERTNVTDPSLFEFVLAPTKYDYILTGVKDKDALTGKVVVPLCYDGLPVTYIGERAFSCCQNITEVVLPYTVKGMGNDSFSGINGSESVTMNITSVVFEDGNGVTFIPDGCFGNCAKLTTFTLPAAVTHVGASAFALCAALESFVIPEGSLLARIEEYAFLECKNLVELTMPGNLNFIYQNAFKGCTGLISVTLKAETMVRLSNKTAFPENSRLKFYVPEKILSEYTSDSDWKDFNFIALPAEG